MDHITRIHAETREQWRAWFQEHHLSSKAVWLVSWKKHTGRPSLTYNEAVREAVAFGWVDSRPARLDDTRTMLYFTPRRTGSAWSRPNKLRVAELERAGAMAEQGRRVVAAARADGSWNLLDDVEELVVPPDLAAAFDRHPGAAQHWDAFPRSAKRGILEWIVQARTSATRDKRTEETAHLASRRERAAQWRPKRTDQQGRASDATRPGQDHASTGTGGQA
jgi:uncharacterized protein YdeI (YjbR/CyaY-like superfamily)